MRVLLLCLFSVTVWSQEMPIAGQILGTSGNYYHEWQLPEASSWEPEESIRFEELENDLGDGYSSQVLYGANTGLRRWRLKLGTLAGLTVLPQTVLSPTGAPVTREHYVWDLFCYTKTTGQPFVYRSLRNSQYFLVRFADKELSYQKMRVQLYSTGIELKQVRIPGEAIFTPYIEIEAGAARRGYTYSPMEPDFWLKGTEVDQGQDGNGFNTTGDVINTTVNGLPVGRFNSVASPSTGYWDFQDPSPFIYYDLFILMKVRSGSFPTPANVVLNSDTITLLVGQNGTTRFEDGNLDPTHEYRLNGTLYEDIDLQAPMNTFGIVHLRFPEGQSIQNMMFGLQTTPANSAKMDIAEVIAFDALLPDSDVNSLMEYLNAKTTLLNG